MYLSPCYINTLTFILSHSKLRPFEQRFRLVIDFLPHLERKISRSWDKSHAENYSEAWTGRWTRGLWDVAILILNNRANDGWRGDGAVQINGHEQDDGESDNETFEGRGGELYWCLTVRPALTTTFEDAKLRSISCLRRRKQISRREAAHIVQLNGGRYSIPQFR